MKAADAAGKMDAISRSQAILEIDSTGNILTANENFLMPTRYRLDEIVGKHHRTERGAEDHPIALRA